MSAEKRAEPSEGEPCLGLEKIMEQAPENPEKHPVVLPEVAFYPRIQKILPALRLGGRLRD